MALYHLADAARNAEIVHVGMLCYFTAHLTTAICRMRHDSTYTSHKEGITHRHIYYDWQKYAPEAAT